MAIKFICIKYLKKNILNKNDWSYIHENLGCINDKSGQWKHPEKCTIIESGNITMKNVNYPLLGIDETGHYKIMIPEEEYTFPGKQVFEIPIKGKYEKIVLQILKN